MLMSRIKHQREWNLHFANGLLLMFDLPEMIQLSGKILNIRKKDSITATINSDESVECSAFGNYLPLDRAIQEFLIDVDGCIICVVEMFSWSWSMIKTYIYLTFTKWFWFDWSKWQKFINAVTRH